MTQQRQMALPSIRERFESGAWNSDDLAWLYAKHAGYTCEQDENPFFCLLEDDSLINEVKITTDRLLTPLESGEAVNDVALVIHVRTIVVNSTKAYIDFYT